MKEKNPAQPKRSLGQSSETEMKHVQDLEVCKRKVSQNNRQTAGEKDRKSNVFTKQTVDA